MLRVLRPQPDCSQPPPEGGEMLRCRSILVQALDPALLVHKFHGCTAADEEGSASPSASGSGSGSSFGPGSDSDFSGDPPVEGGTASFIRSAALRRWARSFSLTSSSPASPSPPCAGARIRGPPPSTVDLRLVPPPMISPLWLTFMQRRIRWFPHVLRTGKEKLWRRLPWASALEGAAAAAGIGGSGGLEAVSAEITIDSTA